MKIPNYNTLSKIKTELLKLKNPNVNEITHILDTNSDDIIKIIRK